MAGFYLKRFYLIPKQFKLLAFYLFGYVSVILAFIGFVLWNGSIVVGDKSAHEAALHLPQVRDLKTKRVVSIKFMKNLLKVYSI